MKMQKAAPVGRRPLGKNGDMLALSQDIGDLCVDHPSVAAAATLQENRVVLGREPADQRPVADFGLGYEGSWQSCVDDVDVDPRNMVGNEQGPGDSVGQISLDLDAERVEQRRRPAGLECQALTVATQRKDAQ